MMTVRMAGAGGLGHAVGRGGVTRIDPDGGQALLAGWSGEPCAPVARYAPTAGTANPAGPHGVSARLMVRMGLPNSR
jgi:hypothetical protein